MYFGNDTFHYRFKIHLLLLCLNYMMNKAQLKSVQNEQKFITLSLYKKINYQQFVEKLQLLLILELI